MLVEELVEEYLMDMASLNVQPAHLYPRVTEEIPQIVEMIEGLIEKGYAYESEGDVYYRVTSFPGYGKLSHRSIEGMMAGARIEQNVQKDHAMDFTLWKKSKVGEPAWPSPWGEGRPGWHIECSAMALHYLGPHLDIHGGGQDLVFPHHENEIAQTEAFTGQDPFASHWVHNGLLQMDQDKMSKSLGNLVTVRDALDKFGSDPHAAVLPELALPQPAGVLGGRDQRAAAGRRPAAGGTGGPHWGRHGRGRRPGAVQGALHRCHGRRPEHAAGAGRRVLAGTGHQPRPRRGQVAGRGAGAPARAHVRAGTAAGAGRRRHGATGQCLRGAAGRGAAGTARHKEFALADRIRSRLQELGVSLEDTPEGTKWRFTSN